MRIENSVLIEVDLRSLLIIMEALVVLGLSESEKEAILERHMADVAMQQDAREEERRRQREMLEVSLLNVSVRQFSCLEVLAN